MKLTPLLLVAACLFTGACIITIDDTGASMHGFSSFQSNGHGPHIRGSGHLASEERAVLPFSGVVMQGSLDVEIQVVTDLAEGKLEVEGDDNLLRYVRTEVHDGMLVIDLEDGSYSMKKPLVVRASTSRLALIELEGSGDISVTGLNNASFRVRLDGSGDIEARGLTQSLTVDLNGSGDINLANLEATEANISLDGSGDVRVFAKHKLGVDLKGSGDIGYRGHPKNSKITVKGSGDVYSFD